MFPAIAHPGNARTLQLGPHSTGMNCIDLYHSTVFNITSIGVLSATCSDGVKGSPVYHSINIHVHTVICRDNPFMICPDQD